MGKDFGKNEKKLVELLSNSKNFTFQNVNYKVEKIGKPRPTKGECKTDIYILAKSIQGCKEFKISVKQNNADFLENKMKLERAIEIFGNDAQQIISKYTLSIKNIFTNENLVFFQKKGRTEAKCITLGWKFELLNKPCGDKSGLVQLTDDQKLEVYSGIDSSDKKRNCTVNGEPIPDSGIANFILEADFTVENEANHYFENIIPVENYIKGKEIYFACKALNYRAEKDKWDGNRPLAVYVDWTLGKNKKLTGAINFDKPLETKGNEVGNKVRHILKSLKINKNNFDNLKNHLEHNIKWF